MTEDELLAEISELTRTMPDRARLHHKETEQLVWLGRVGAVLKLWNAVEAVRFGFAVDRLHALKGTESAKGESEILILLHEARHSLTLASKGPTSTVHNSGAVFDYFDDIRAIIEQATTDILIVDPYLDAEFVTRYLPSVKGGVSVRMLTSDPKKLATLLPAVSLFAQQHSLNAGVRSTKGIHDRFLFLDGQMCFQSGASFKDGAKAAPVTVSQIVDAASTMVTTYEGIWATAKTEL